MTFDDPNQSTKGWPKGEPEDEELVRWAQQGARDDLRPFERLVRRHQGRVVANCRHIAGSADADDLAQEVFVKAFYALKRLERQAAFKPWLMRIKVNHCLTHVTKRSKRTYVDVDDPTVAADPELEVAPQGQAAVEASEERERIEQVLDAMPETLRVPLILRDLDGLGYQEIADELGIGLSAVKMRIKRGRATFRELFESDGPREAVA